MNSTTMEQPCPVCAGIGKGIDGDDLTVLPSGKFHWIADGKEKAHSRRIIDLMPELRERDNPPLYIRACTTAERGAQ